MTRPRGGLQRHKDLLSQAVCASKGSSQDHVGAGPISENNVVAGASHKEISTVTTEGLYRSYTYYTSH